MGAGSWKKQIPVEKVIDFARKAHACNPELPIISVGSGNGYTENELSKCGGMQVICVDPKPGVWKDEEELKLYKDADYPTVQVMLREKPELKGSHLLLIWPSPDLEYSIEAIELLEPTTCTILFEKTGVAGCKRLQQWIANSCGSTYVCEPIAPTKHLSVGSFSKTHIVSIDEFHYCLELFVRKGMGFTAEKIGIKSESISDPPVPGAVNMGDMLLKALKKP